MTQSTKIEEVTTAVDLIDNHRSGFGGNNESEIPSLMDTDSSDDKDSDNDDYIDDI